MMHRTKLDSLLMVSKKVLMGMCWYFQNIAASRAGRATTCGFRTCGFFRLMSTTFAQRTWQKSKVHTRNKVVPPNTCYVNRCVCGIPFVTRRGIQLRSTKAGHATMFLPTDCLPSFWAKNHFPVFRLARTRSSTAARVLPP